jgi:fatty acid desaturase
MPKRGASSPKVTGGRDDEQHVSTAELSGEAVSDTPLQSVSLLRSLISFKEINNIAGQRSNLEGLKQTVFHGGCIFLAGLLTKTAWASVGAGSNIFGWVALGSAILLQAFFLSFLFMPLHESVHLTAFSSKWLNKSLGFIVGLATLRPPVHYKLYHFAHHRFTGNKEKDPELSDTLLDPDIKSIFGYILYLSSIPFWVSRPATVIKHALGSISPTGEYFIATSKQKQEIVSEARLFCLIYAVFAAYSVVMGSYSMLVYWVIPTVIGQPFLRFYLLAEHTGCQLGANMMTNTRTTATYAFYRKLAWNMPFHSEHHAWPSVPFHKLPMVNTLISGRIDADGAGGCNPTGQNGYIGVHTGFVAQILSRARKSA